MTANTILTIDDDKDINSLISVMLKKNGMNVVTCSDIKDFFQKVVEVKPNLCLVDLNLGDYEGFGFGIISSIRKKIGNDMIIIVMSRRSSRTDINRALEAGANDYIQKPLDENILVSKLNVFLNTKSSDTKFPKRAVPSDTGECYFEVPMNITSLNESQIFLYSRSYIAKGSLVSLHSEFFKGHKFGVQSVTLDRELGGYILEIHINNNDHQHILPEIRRLMLLSSPIED